MIKHGMAKYVYDFDKKSWQHKEDRWRFLENQG